MINKTISLLSNLKRIVSHMKIKYTRLITVLFLAAAAITFLLSGNPQTLGNSLEYTDQKSDEYIEPAPTDTPISLPGAQAALSVTPSGNPGFPYFYLL